MNTDRLRTFHVLAGELHFRRAAEKRHLSQSAVSQQIAALEQEVGAPLFERIGRRVYLTDAGRVLAEEAGRVLAALTRAADAVRDLGRGDAGRLRVGASTTPGIYLLPEMLGRFRAEMPLVDLAFQIRNSTEIEAAVAANELDLGVVGDKVTHDELFEIPLGEDRVVAVAAASLAGKTRRLSAKDLARWPLLSREEGSATRKIVDGALAAAGVALAPTFELPSPEALLRAAVAGLGVTFASRFAVEREIAGRKLVELSVRGVEIVRGLYACHHRDKRVTAAMRLLVDLLRRRIRRRGIR